MAGVRNGGVGESAQVNPSNSHGADHADHSGTSESGLPDSNDRIDSHDHPVAEHSDVGGNSADSAGTGANEGQSPADGTPYSGSLVEVHKADPHADLLAERLQREPRVRFANDPDAREFDAVSKDYIGQAKPSTIQVNKAFRVQAKATFEAAKETGRSVYYHFEGGSPAEGVVRRLQEYADRYGVSLVIDDTPLGG